jgi:hypothetical protein
VISRQEVDSTFSQLMHKARIEVMFLVVRVLQWATTVAVL